MTSKEIEIIKNIAVAALDAINAIYSHFGADYEVIRKLEKSIAELEEMSPNPDNE